MSKSIFLGSGVHSFSGFTVSNDKSFVKYTWFYNVFLTMLRKELEHTLQIKKNINDSEHYGEDAFVKGFIQMVIVLILFIDIFWLC